MKCLIFLLLIGVSFNSFSDVISGTLGADVSATHYLVVTCSVDGSMIPDKMYFRINSLSTKPLVSAQVAKDNFVTNMTSKRGGAEIRQGEGEYRITIDKNGNGVARYSIEYHCESGGNHTETTLESRN